MYKYGDKVWNVKNSNLQKLLAIAFQQNLSITIVHANAKIDNDADPDDWDWQGTNLFKSNKYSVVSIPNMSGKQFHKLMKTHFKNVSSQWR